MTNNIEFKISISFTLCNLYRHVMCVRAAGHFEHCAITSHPLTDRHIKKPLELYVNIL
jgi:hypothetical protein